MTNYLIDKTYQNNSNLKIHLRKILDECVGKSDITIIFEEGVYLFDDELAIKEFNDLMNSVLNYDTHWGKGDIAYNKGLVFEDINGLTIIGNNSTLLFEGLISPITIKGCSNVSIEGLVIDWKRPPFTIGKIISVHNETVKVKIHQDFSITGNEPIWALMDYDPMKKRFDLVWKFRNMSPLRKINDELFEFEASIAKDLIINHDIVLRHVGNYRPCIHILESELLYFDNITIHNNPGMGIVGHYSKNISFRNLKVMPKKDHIMSTTTDATHFINCEGLLDFENCYFEGMGDDAINVHGFYNYITKKIDNYTVEVTILNENGTQDQVFDLPRIGDMAEFSKVYDLKPFGKENEVVSYTVDDLKWKATITFKDPISNDVKEGDLLTKTNDVAGLRFVNCHIKSIRARACLIQTKNVVIEDCLIENCTGTGIHIDTATGWWEAVRCENVHIRHNIIKDCGYGDGTYHGTSGIAIITECEGDAVGIHNNIVIENNTIYGNNDTAITVQCTDGCRILRNTIKNCETAIDVSVSDHVTLEGNDIQNQKLNLDVTSNVII